MTTFVESFTAQLVVMTCPVHGCGVVYGLTRSYREQRSKDGRSWLCPNGHSLSYHETELDREKKARETAEQQAQWAREDADRQRILRDKAERSASASRGHFKRIKSRVANGVCPCCRRSFDNVRRHVETQHPEWKEAAT